MAAWKWGHLVPPLRIPGPFPTWTVLAHEPDPKLFLSFVAQSHLSGRRNSMRACMGDSDPCMT